MKKKILALIIAVLLCIVSVVPAFATSEYGYVVDEAGLLSESELEKLTDLCSEIAQRQEMDIAIITASSLDGEEAVDVADYLFEEMGYGYGDNKDGAFLLVDMDSRTWAIERMGFGEEAFTDAGVDYIAEQFKSFLGDEEYYEAFECFANLCDDFITQAKEGEPYDSGNLPKAPFKFMLNLIISLGVGLVVGFIVSLVLKGQLKSVRFQSAASDYEKPGSMVVTDSREYFLYSTVKSEKKADNSSSSGNSNSGSARGGSF